MEDVIKIRGGRKLNGEVHISSAKNAAVALIPAAVLANHVVTFLDIPNISDIDSLVELLEFLNVNVIRRQNTLVIDPGEIQNVTMNHEAVTRLRASYYFLGALLGRFKKVKMKMPGGCDLGPRPINLHLKGFEALGAVVDYDNGFYTIEAEHLHGNNIYLDFASVGATINIMMAAALADGRTTIENAAKEPEIIDVATLLNKMGAEIRGAGTDIITIDGVKELSGCVHEIIPDRIEAGTYIIIGAACGEHVKVNNVIPQHLDALLSKLQDMGVKMNVGSDYVEIFASDNLHAVDIKTLPYPGLATDLQQPLTTLLTKAVGVSKVTETIYPERFKHCHELNKMGADIEVYNGQSIINGPTPLHGDVLTATDLRCGAALIIAGLIGEGETVIRDAYHIYRGYDSIKEKLRALEDDIE